jgi:hypothetical protein
MDIVLKESAFGHRMETMTEEEAFALDEYYTNNPPKVDPAKALIRIPIVRLDNTNPLVDKIMKI